MAKPSKDGDAKPRAYGLKNHGSRVAEKDENIRRFRQLRWRLFLCRPRRRERFIVQKRRFALVTVLVILLVLTFLSAIIMDLTLNSHNSTMDMIQDSKLYNAAQSGVE